MKTYKNLYPKIYSYKNLELAFKKAKKNKSNLIYVKEYEENLTLNLKLLQQELFYQVYRPTKLKKFIIRDPKTRVIRKSIFKDRIVHHALINILEPIYEKIFINDSYASRKNKGTHNALKRFDNFKRKVTNNGELITNSKNNNMIQGYVLKADIRHFFDSVDQDLLIKILQKKIKDKKVINLITLILKNFENDKGMPLGNLTSQFFANVYLNELDYFIKHKLKIKYYLRYVDDFVILHKDKKILNNHKTQINNFLKTELRLELHPDKSKIFHLYRGVNLLGLRVFYHHKLLRKRNLRQFYSKFNKLKTDYNQGKITKNNILESIQGWFGYAQHANTYKLRKNILKHYNNLNKSH